MHRRSRAVLLIILVALYCFPILFCNNVAISQTTDSYYPANYALAGATRYISGSLGDLQTNDEAYMTFQSYPSQASSRSLYAHQETTTLAGTDYYVSNPDMADRTGTDLSATLSSAGRRSFGEFIYPLTGVTSILSSTWTIYYRTWFSNVTEDVMVNSPSWIPQILWGNVENAYSTDNTYAYSSNPGARQQYGNYGLDLPLAANVTKVEVGYEAHTAGDERISVSLSWDGGVRWTVNHVSSLLEKSDLDIVSWLDFTADTNWNASMFSDANFRSRVAVLRVGNSTDDVFVDWLPVKVTYVGSPPSTHLDADIRIRKSDGALRQTLVTDVANSESLSATVQTLSGTYDWPGYAVVDETDYFEIDFYVDTMSAKQGAIAFLRIDDVNLVTVDQTRIANIMFPSEFTVDVELSGYSDTNDWSEIFWTFDSSWTTENVSVTSQLYDYLQGTYPNSGDGNIAFTSSSIPNTDETKAQTIMTNATDFRDYLGNWKMKIKGIKPATSQFSLKLDLSMYKVTTLVHHDVAILGVTYSPTSIYLGDSVAINVTVKNEGDTPESFNVTLYCDNSQITKNNIANLTPNESILLTFNWNTTGTMQGARVLKAVADIVRNEDEIADNTFICDGFVNILPAKDDGSSLPLWNWTWALLSIPFLILLFAGVRWKRRKNKPKSIGIEFLNEITGGGIPDSYSVMLVGGSDSGKSVLFQELALVFLKMKKPCIYVAYECFPDEIRKNVKKFQWDTSTYESGGKLSFIDCFSSSAKVQSKEKYFLNQPFSLIDLGIILSKSTNEAGDSPKVFLDSITPLLTQLDQARVIDFLQDRIARVKGVNGNLIFTSNKESMDPAMMSRLEEIVDCIIELDASQVKEEIVRRLRIKKMRGRSPSDKWVLFEISLEKGINFLV